MTTMRWTISEKEPCMEMRPTTLGESRLEWIFSSVSSKVFAVQGEREKNTIKLVQSTEDFLEHSLPYHWDKTEIFYSILVPLSLAWGEKRERKLTAA